LVVPVGGAVVNHDGVGELAVVVVVVVQGQAELLEVVGALGACGSLADLLDGGEEQADQDGDDGDHHQQLDQRQATPAPKWVGGRHVGLPCEKRAKKQDNA